MSLNMQPREFTLEPESTVFSSHFDMVQEQLETLASMDDLLSGKKTKLILYVGSSSKRFVIVLECI